MDGPDALADPAPDAAAALAEDAVAAGRLLSLVGRCAVDYEGRASGHLGPGDRHVLRKPDGALLVHGPTGGRPEAWHPPGADAAAAVEGGALVLRSERENPDGELVVRFDAVAHAAAHDAEEGTVEVSGTEADLRRRVLDAPDLVEEGFRPLATERDTAAGAVDVYGEDADGRAVAVELKRRRAGPDAAGQLARYVAALERDLHAEAEVRGVLVAPSITDRCRRVLVAEGLEFVPLGP